MGKDIRKGRVLRRGRAKCRTLVPKGSARRVSSSEHLAGGLQGLGKASKSPVSCDFIGVGVQVIWPPLVLLHVLLFG